MEDGAVIMKALIRNAEETITESMGIIWINWQTGAPLTNPAWAGGPYILVNDYTPIVEDDFTEDLPTAASTAPAPEDDTVVIDGVVYRRA